MPKDVVGENGPKRKGCLRRIVGWIGRLFLAFALILVVAFLIVFRTALYNRFVAFPKQAQAWSEIQAQRQEVLLDDTWNEYRGACHCHSDLSHDSDGTFEQLLAAAKEAGLDFIFMAEHCHEGKGDYSKGWKGDHDGVTFVRGFEMSQGFMPWGLPDDTVLRNDQDPYERAREIRAKGGVIFYAHPEEPRIWDLPELTGTEIYNIHADFKGEGLGSLAPDLILSLGKYPDQAFRMVFDRQTEILAHWDELNQNRKIVGIAANDAHQNVGFRGYYTEKDTFLLRERAPSDIKEWKLNWFTRGLLRLSFGPLTPGKELFNITLDPYQRSLRFVNTHLLARSKTEPDLVDALREGRVFVAFDMLADARGFVFTAQEGEEIAVMGQTIALRPGLKLKAESPLPCHFALVRNGKRETEQTGRTFEYELGQPGNYRLEGEIKILDEWTPWVYTNPIFVREGKPAATVAK